jgi:hypothetical protein
LGDLKIPGCADIFLVTVGTLESYTFSTFGALFSARERADSPISALAPMTLQEAL